MGIQQLQGARRNSASVKKDAAAEVRLLRCSKIIIINPEDYEMFMKPYFAVVSD